MKHTGATNVDANAIGTSEAWFGNPLELSETQWASICADRLVELRPFSDPHALQAIASDMARTLRYFDPTMAAEMEHEGGMLDD